MANIASLLKSEISRVARKEVRGEIAGLKKAVSSYRSEIARPLRSRLTIRPRWRPESESTAPFWPDPAEYVWAAGYLADRGVPIVTHAIGDAGAR